MTLEERKNEAIDLRKQGYNCAQSVLGVFPDKTGVEQSLAMRLASGLGGGVGGCGEICGVIIGMAIVDGLVNDSQPGTKVKVSKTVNSLTGEFKLKHGCIRCKELKGKTPPCNCTDLILDGIELLHKHYDK